MSCGKLPLNWGDLLSALALVMVIEGIVPFVSPQSMRRMLESVSRIDDRVLRFTGLVSMISGVILLYVVRH